MIFPAFRDHRWDEDLGFARRERRVEVDRGGYLSTVLAERGQVIFCLLVSVG